MLLSGVTSATGLAAGEQRGALAVKGVRKRSRLKPEGVGPSVRAITWHVTPDESASVPGTSFLI